MTIEEAYALMSDKAALEEERRKDREEYEQARRESQRRLDEIDAILRRSSDSDERVDKRTQWTGEEDRAAHDRLVEADKRLGERIDALLAAIRELEKSKPQ